MDQPTPAPNAVGTFGAFRECEHGRGIAYLATMETTGPAAVDAVLHASDRAGAAHPAGSDCGPHFAALDLLDADGDEVGDRCVPTRDAWEWWRRAVDRRASSSDCRTCEPAAYDAVRAARLPRNARRA